MSMPVLGKRGVGYGRVARGGRTQPVAKAVCMSYTPALAREALESDEVA